MRCKTATVPQSTRAVRVAVLVGRVLYALFTGWTLCKVLCRSVWTTSLNRTASGAYAERLLVCCFARAVPEAVRTASCAAPWGFVFRHFTACFHQLYCRVAGSAGDVFRDFLELVVPHSAHRRIVKNTVPLFEPQLHLLLWLCTTLYCFSALRHNWAELSVCAG